jgi:hypothetical protein
MTLFPESVRKLITHRVPLSDAPRMLADRTNSQRCWNSPEFVSDFVRLAEGTATYLANLDTCLSRLEIWKRTVLRLSPA